MKELYGIASYALECLKREGADEAQCVVSAVETREFNADGGQFSLFRTLFDHSLSLTAFKDGRRGRLAVNKLDEEAIARAAKECLAVAQAGQSDPAWEMNREAGEQTYAHGAYQPDLDAFFARTRELLADITEKYPRIIVEKMITSHAKVDRVYLNTHGVCHREQSGHYDVDLSYAAHEGEATSSLFGGGVRTDKLDVTFLSLGTLEQDLEDTQNQIYTTPVEGKFTGTVLLPPGMLMQLLNMALNNFAGDTTVLDGTSLWKDKLDTRVADSSITLRMAPLDSRVVGGQRFTGEGFTAGDYTVLEEGVLKNFLISAYVANKTGNRRAPNSAGYNYVMEAGDTPLADIISGIENGLLVGRFSGGEPGANGDFSGVAKNSFLIRDGKVAGAVSETMINGNLADVLMHLRAISREVAMDGVSVLPWAAFDGVVISGK